MKPCGKLIFWPTLLLWVFVFLALGVTGLGGHLPEKSRGKVAFESLGGLGFGNMERTAQPPKALAEAAETLLVSLGRHLESDTEVADRISPYQTKFGLGYHFPRSSRQGGGGSGGVLPPLHGHSPPLG